MAAPHSGVDVEQLVFRLPQEVRLELLVEAWRRLDAHHPALRTSFHWEGIAEPVQRVHDEVDQAFEEHDWRDLLTRAQELRMPFGPVMSPRLLHEDEHIKARGFFQEVEQPELGRTKVAGAPFKMSETPLRTGPAPTLGEHTHEVLLDLGYDSEDARILRERGVT